MSCFRVMTIIKISMRLTWKADYYISAYHKGVKSGDEDVKKVMMASVMISSLTVIQV